MPDVREAIIVRVVTSLDDVDPQAWDACAGDDNPFVSYSFLSALEDSGSATGETGWACQHLIIEDGDGSPGGGLAKGCSIVVGIGVVGHGGVLGPRGGLWQY